MRAILNSLVIAFSMYSKIPMPRCDWNEKNMRYVMCFFPLVGVIVGGLFWGWMQLSEFLPLHSVAVWIVAILIPVAVTGGIHIDGLLDTTDALSSYQSRDSRLEILKDPRAGAFAILGGIVYFLLYLAVYSELAMQYVPLLAVSFVLSRALSGLAVVVFPKAKNTGLAAAFSDAAQKKTVRNTMFVYIAVCIVALCWISPLYALVSLGVTGILYVYYYRMAVDKFGGITGDLAGWFLQLEELLFAMAVIVTGLFLK
ncbi:MAG: adenosylcobinamide-GDP ribazoletransferase [Lachnospiraceae bacterium]